MRIALNLILKRLIPVMALVTEWINQTGEREKRDEKSDVGGTMRLGGQACTFECRIHCA